MQSTTPKQPVLVVANSDGYLEVYGDKSLVDVHIVNKPHMTSDEGEILAQEYMELELPKRHRDVFWPVNLVDTHQVRRMTPDDLAQRETDIELCNVLTAVGNELRTEPTQLVT